MRIQVTKMMRIRIHNTAHTAQKLKKIENQDRITV